MSTSKLVWVCAGTLVLHLSMMAQIAQEEQRTEIKHVPIQMSSAASGREMFVTYCAVCHGRNAKGDGPATQALKVPPPDLTLLSRQNGKKYPALKVASVLRGQSELASHGSQDMPVWGKLFRTISKGHEAEVDQRITNLTNYIGSLQAQ